jgi:cell division protein FtsB
MDGLARAMQEALARLCGQSLNLIRGTLYVHLARHDSMGSPMDLLPHPEVKHHVEQLDFMLIETRKELDNSCAYINQNYLHQVQRTETIKLLANERKSLRRERTKKDHLIARLRAKIASLKETVVAQEAQIKDLEGEGEGEDLQGDNAAYLSDDGDYEEDEDLDYHIDVDGYEYLDAGMDDYVQIEVDGDDE